MAAGPPILLESEYPPDDELECLVMMTADIANSIGNCMPMSMTHDEAKKLIMNQTEQFLEGLQDRMPGYELDDPERLLNRNRMTNFKNRETLLRLIVDEYQTAEYIDHIVTGGPDTYGHWSMLEWQPITITMSSIEATLHAWPERLEKIIVVGVREQMLKALINRRIDNG